MKRFTETQKWEDPWFRRLKPEMKLLWQWILDRCDGAGIIDPDIELASFQIGYQYPLDTLSEFGDRVVDLDGGKYFIPKFIAFQYGQLSEDCRAHGPALQSLRRHGLEGYSKGIQPLKVKVKVKDTEKETEKDSYARDEIQVLAEIIWAATPKMGRERSSLKKLTDSIRKTPAKDRPTMQQVSESLAAWNHSESWTKDGGKFVAGIHRWANDQGWTQKPEPASNNQAGIQENIPFTV